MTSPISYFIVSKLNGNVVDILGASMADGAGLDAWPVKSIGTQNQLWQLVPDPAGSGYYFLRSLLNGNVIDIQGASMADGADLDAWPMKSTGTQNQLWQLVSDPAGSGYYFLQSLLNGNVIDIQGASTVNGAGLDAWPMKSSGTQNQLWMLSAMYTQAFFEFWTTTDDLRQDSTLTAAFLAPPQPVVAPAPPVQLTQTLTVKAFNAPKFDNWNYNSVSVPLNGLSPAQLGTCVLSLVQGGTGFGESSDEWHVGAIRITLQNPGALLSTPGAGAQQVIFGDPRLGDSPLLNAGGNYQAPTVWILNQANPSIVLNV
jgi:hypothetical protein